MLQSWLDDYRCGRLSLPDLLAHLRPYYHSLHGARRHEVVEALSSLPDAEASRELVLLFQHSLWRTTRIQIIKALSRHPNTRGLELLMRLATDDRDLALSERALWSLGASRDLLASRFLVHLYEGCPETLGPKIVAALGASLDGTSAPRFLKDLEHALQKGRPLLARNLALALAEFKEPQAIPFLRSMARDATQPLLAQSALLALGKVSRDPHDIADLEEAFQSDFHTYQMFISVKTQVTFRSQWKLEDYLIKLFDTRQFHPALPMELNAFSQTEVREGLRLFTEPRHRPRLAAALSRLHGVDILAWYDEFFPREVGDDASLNLMLRSLRFHFGPQVEPLLKSTCQQALQSSDDALVDAWLETTALSLPRPEILLEEVFETVEKSCETRRVLFLNHLTNAALMADGKRKKHFVRLIEQAFRWKGTEGRCLRALGQLETIGNKTHSFVKEHINDEQLFSSITFLTEKTPSRQSAEILAQLTHKKGDIKQQVALLKSWGAQKEIPRECEADFLELVSRNLEPAVGPLPRAQALHCASAHPRAVFLGAITKALKDEQVQMPAIIAAKAQNDEAVVEPLGACLNSPSESVVGRAVDALTALPWARAKRLVLDLLVRQPLNADLCDKLSRCLEAPQGAADFFAQKVTDILNAHPHHPQHESLAGMRDRFTAGMVLSRGSREAAPPELAGLDSALAERLPGYTQFDDDIKSALRAAEIPFHRPEIFRGAVDKSNTIIAYCKAIDLLLERQLGRKMLFPQLEAHLHEFQNLLHTAQLDDTSLPTQRALESLGLQGSFSRETLPLHKMTLISQGILSGKILSEHWKIVDGLRAWAVVLLIFARAPLPCVPQRTRPLIDLKVDGETLIDFSKRLIALQDLRNPAAHRETWLRFPELDEVRANVTELIRRWQAMTLR